MRLINKVLLSVIMVCSFSFSKEYTFYDLQNLINSKYGITVVCERDIADSYVIYSDKLQRDITLTEVESMIVSSGYNYSKLGNVIHISAKSKAQKKTEEHKVQLDQKKKEHDLQLKLKVDEQKVNEGKFYSRIIYTDLPLDSIDSICKQMNYQCEYVSSGAYLVRSKDKVISTSFFNTFRPGNQYALVGTILEINKNTLTDMHIDINAFANAVLSSKFINVSLTGQYGNLLQAYSGPDNKVSLDVLFKFMTTNGAAKIVSKPYLLLQDNKLTTFTNGQSVQVASSVINNAEKAVSQTSYETLDIGLSVKAQPRFGNNYVYVDLSMNISSLLDYDKDKNIANIANRTLGGFYRMVPGREIRLVGFEQTYKNQQRSSIPILSDLPVVGALFRGKYNDGKNSILVVSFKLIKISDASKASSYGPQSNTKGADWISLF